MGRWITIVGATLCVSLAAGASGASAQTPPPSAPQQEGGAGPTLSEKLNRTDGVIAPPAGVDSAMPVKPPVPNPNSMPVITPPGEPGGNQSVQPK